MENVIAIFEYNNQRYIIKFVKEKESAFLK